MCKKHIWPFEVKFHQSGKTEKLANFCLYAISPGVRIICTGSEVKRKLLNEITTKLEHGLRRLCRCFFTLARFVGQL